MLISTPTIHRLAAFVLLIASLVLLADRTARIELAWAVGATLHDGAHVEAHISAAEE